jgi:hypothetical protein
VWRELKRPILPMQQKGNVYQPVYFNIFKGSLYVGCIMKSSLFCMTMATFVV